MVFKGYCVDVCETVAKNKTDLFCTVSFSGIVLSRKCCLELKEKGIGTFYALASKNNVKGPLFMHF